MGARTTAGEGHQGQDIRAATCEKGVHWVVAATDGTITNVGSYSVYLGRSSLDTLLAGAAGMMTVLSVRRLRRKVR